MAPLPQPAVSSPPYGPATQLNCCAQRQLARTSGPLQHGAQPDPDSESMVGGAMSPSPRWQRTVGDPADLIDRAQISLMMRDNPEKNAPCKLYATHSRTVNTRNDWQPRLAGTDEPCPADHAARP